MHGYYIQLVQELCHVNGKKFTCIGEVREKVSSLGERWSNKLVPALSLFAKETDEPPPCSDLPNGMPKCVTITCIVQFMQVYYCHPNECVHYTHHSYRFVHVLLKHVGSET